LDIPQVEAQNHSILGSILQQEESNGHVQQAPARTRANHSLLQQVQGGSQESRQAQDEERHHRTLHQEPSGPEHLHNVDDQTPTAQDQEVKRSLQKSANACRDLRGDQPRHVSERRCNTIGISSTASFKHDSYGCQHSAQAPSMSTLFSSRTRQQGLLDCIPRTTSSKPTSQSERV
jgi:hypothetical protein